MYRRFFTAVLACLSIGSLPATAAVIEATYSGHLFSGGDGLGLFGGPTILPTGAPVSVTFRYDTSLGKTPTLPYLGSGLEGGQILGTPGPVVFSSISIGAATVIGQNNGYSLVGNIDDAVMGNGLIVGATGRYPGAPLPGFFAGISAYVYGQGLPVPSSIGVPFSLTGLSALNVQGGTSRATGTFQFSDCNVANVCGYTFGEYLIDDFQSRTLPAPVPLPAAGGFLAGALGFLGVARRVRRRDQIAA